MILDLFGSQWYQSIEVMQVLVMLAVFHAANIPAGTIYKISGRAWIILAATLPYLVVLFLALLLFAQQGILAVAICMTVCQSTVAIIAIVIAGKILAVPYRRIGGTMIGPLVAALGMGVVVFFVEYLVKQPWPALIAGVLAGVIVYTGLLWRFLPDIPERLLGNIRSRFKSRTPVEQSASSTLHS